MQTTLDLGTMQGSSRTTAPPRRGVSRAAAARGPAVAGTPLDSLLALDIETIPDEGLIPPGWPAERFPKNAWHRIVAVSFVTADIDRGSDGAESYAITSCRSGGEAGWDEGRLLRAFWRFFGAGRYRVVTWNGRSFDMPTILARSMMHGVEAPEWFRRGDRWQGYRHRFAIDWHTDLMDAISEHGAAQRLTLEEAAATVGLPGKLGEHGTRVAAMVAAGEIERVRDYCETDCLNLVVLYLRWAHLTGRTDARSHDLTVIGIMDYLDREREARPHLGRFVDAWRATAGARATIARLPRATDP